MLLESKMNKNMEQREYLNNNSNNNNNNNNNALFYKILCQYIILEKEQFHLSSSKIPILYFNVNPTSGHGFFAFFSFVLCIGCLLSSLNDIYRPYN